MLRIFRTIRRNLLVGEKINRYAIYAIGEIFLVMVGILLALQVNNWNEHRKEKLELKDYLLEIRNNIEVDINIARRQLDRRDSVRSWNINAKNLIIEDQYPLKDFIKAQNFFYEFYFISIKTGFDALKNSGLKGKLRNTSIDSLLNEYYYKIEKIAQSETSYNTFIESMEKEFSTQFSAVQYNYLLQSFSDSLEILDPGKYNELQASLLPYFQSNTFQSGVYRAAAQTSPHLSELISVGDELIKSINEYMNVSSI